MRAATFWATLSGGLALGSAGAAMSLTAHAATLSGMALVVPAVTVATVGLLTLACATGTAVPLRAPAPTERRRADRNLSPAPVAADESVLPVIAFCAEPVVSVADGRVVAAVAIEPNFRRPDYAYVTPEAVAWDRVPPAITARLDATLLERAADRAAEGDGRAAAPGATEAVVVSVAASSLRDPAFLARLAAVLGGTDGEGRRRATPVVLARGAIAEVAGLIAGLPAPWREHLGLHLVSPPADAAELDLCLGVGLGCLEVGAPLLDDASAGGDLTRRLVERVAAADVPVVVSGVVDRAVLRRLGAYPVLFARGPLFATARGLAAA